MVADDGPDPVRRLGRAVRAICKHAAGMRGAVAMRRPQMPSGKAQR